MYKALSTKRYYIFGQCTAKNCRTHRKLSWWWRDRYKSGIAIFPCQVASNYAHSPLNRFHLSFVVFFLESNPQQQKQQSKSTEFTFVQKEKQWYLHHLLSDTGLKLKYFESNYLTMWFEWIICIMFANDTMQLEDAFKQRCSEMQLHVSYTMQLYSCVRLITI